MDYDIVIIGGGAAGLFAASVANVLGAKTCLIDRVRLGGDCTWFGCMPSKALLKSSAIANEIKRANQYGLELVDSTFKADNVMQHVRDVVEEIATHHPNEVFEKRGIKVIIGSPRFIAQDEIEINGDRIGARKFIVATGSHPVIPPIKGINNIKYFTNENIFDIDQLPKSIIVLGGGPIGIELSQAMLRLGVDVTIVEMADRILFREDRDIAAYLEKELVAEGIKINTSCKAVEVKTDKNGIELLVETKDSNIKSFKAQSILVAVGRAPNVVGLDLEKAQVKYNNRGVDNNAFLQTSNKNIFVCGDVASPYQFSHVAAYTASVAVRNALFKRVAWVKKNYNNVAWATFTEPQLSHLGMTEQEARQKNKNLKVYSAKYSSNDRKVTDVLPEGMIKIITNKKGLILGAHIVGDQASEIMQGLIVAKSMKVPLAKLGGLLYIYPTLSELVKKTAAQALVEKGKNPLVKILIKFLKG